MGGGWSAFRTRTSSADRKPALDGSKAGLAKQCVGSSLDASLRYWTHAIERGFSFSTQRASLLDAVLKTLAT